MSEGVTGLISLLFLPPPASSSWGQGRWRVAKAGEWRGRWRCVEGCVGREEGVEVRWSTWSSYDRPPPRSLRGAMQSAPVRSLVSIYSRGWESVHGRGCMSFVSDKISSCCLERETERGRGCMQERYFAERLSHMYMQRKFEKTL